MAVHKFPIMEIFGPTIQGEGEYVGLPTVFIRLAGCDSRCALCDTPESIHASNAKEFLTAKEIAKRAEVLTIGGAVKHFVITGGNPAVHEHAGEICKELRKLYPADRDVWIHVETQGTFFTPWIAEEADCIVVSPKGPGMQDEHYGPHKPENVVQFVNRVLQVHRHKEVIIKPVYTGTHDLPYLKGLIKAMQGIKNPHGNWLELVISLGDNIPNVGECPNPGEYKELVNQLMEEPVIIAAANRILPQVHKCLGIA